jgi:hypothetical protein
MNVGEVVTLKVMNANGDKAHLYASGVIREFCEYTGQILPNPKWVTSDSICISTGDTQFPFRIIDRERIVGLGAAFVSCDKPRTETFVVQGSKPGSTYTVTRDGDHWSCTCVGFGFRKDCKHVRECK